MWWGWKNEEEESEKAQKKKAYKNAIMEPITLYANLKMNRKKPNWVLRSCYAVSLSATGGGPGDFNLVLQNGKQGWTKTCPRLQAWLKGRSR